MVTLQSRLSTDECDKKINSGELSWLRCSVAMTAEFVLFIAIKKFVLRTSFRTTLLRKLRCTTNEKQSRKILIKRNGVRRNNTYENDNPSTKVITGKTAKALHELVRTTSILWHKIWHHGQPEPIRQNKLRLKQFQTNNAVLLDTQIRLMNTLTNSF